MVAWTALAYVTLSFVYNILYNCTTCKRAPRRHCHREANIHLLQYAEGGAAQMTESAGTAQGVVEAKLLGGVRGGKQRVKIKIGFAGGRGPENVFVGPLSPEGFVRK